MKACDLQFVCGKKWDELPPIPDASGRYCEDCRKAVFMVKTTRQLHIAAALGRCVGIADDNDFIGVIGDPGAPGSFDWMEEGYFEGISIKLLELPTAERLDQLRLLFPKLFDRGSNEHSLLEGNLVHLENLSTDERQEIATEFQTHAPELQAIAMTPNPAFQWTASGGR